jgi:hypothetical protein
MEMCKFAKPSILYNNMAVSLVSTVTELDHVGRISGGNMECFCSSRMNTSSKYMQRRVQWVPGIQSREIRVKWSAAHKCGG